MALEGSDLLAIYREDTKQSLKVTIDRVAAFVPAPAAPTINAVLQQGNVSKDYDLLFEAPNGEGNSLSLSQTTGNVTSVGNISAGGKLLCSGAAPELSLTNSTAGIVTTGKLSIQAITEEDPNSPNTQVSFNTLVVNNVEGTRIDFQFAGSKVASLTNAGLFEANNIDGGEY